MKFCNNNTLQEFVGRLVETFKYENEWRELNNKKFDIPFLVSGLWEDLTNNYECYNEFCSDLRD